MAPQATLVVPTQAAASYTSFSAPGNTSHKPFIPVALLVFLGLCFAYTFSYVLYRIITSRRLASEDNIPDSPDRGVSRFMNGNRHRLNFGHRRKPTASTLGESLNMEEKLHTDSSRPSPHEIRLTSPGESSTPIIILVPPMVTHPNQEVSQVQLPEQDQDTPQGTPQDPSSTLLPPPPVAQPPFTQRVAAKVKFLSRDRAEAIALDPKLAPVQGPLRPLSMVPSPPHRRRALFGLGLKPLRNHDEGPNVDSGVR